MSAELDWKEIWSRHIKAEAQWTSATTPALQELLSNRERIADAVSLWHQEAQSIVDGIRQGTAQIDEDGSAILYYPSAEARDPFPDIQFTFFWGLSELIAAWCDRDKDCRIDPTPFLAFSRMTEQELAVRTAREPSKLAWELAEAELAIQRIMIGIRTSGAMAEWSRKRSPKEWLSVLKALGDDISPDTFARRRKGESQPAYRVSPDSTTRRVSIALADLPRGYDDKRSAADYRRGT